MRDETVKRPDLFGVVHETFQTEGEINMSAIEPVQGELDVDGKREAWGKGGNCPDCGVALDGRALAEHQRICTGVTLLMTMPPDSMLFPRK